MTDKPNIPARPAQVSKAPPPINPIKGTHYTAPNLPQIPPPNWGKWGYMRDLELWEAVALSQNLEPDQLPVYLGAFDKLGDDPFRICPLPFLERLLVANSNCGILLRFKPVHELKARCLVDLPDFAAWAVKMNIPDMPPELVAMAATTEQADYQKTPEYQAEYAKAWESLDAVDDIEKAIKVWEAASAPTVSELKEKERTIAALKSKRDALTASVFPIESKEPAPVQRLAPPAPVVAASDGPAKRSNRKPPWATVAMPYMKSLFTAGHYKSAAMFYKALMRRAGESDSPFTLVNRELYCTAAGTTVSDGALGNVWAEIRAH